jgi:hypothetical protein
MALRNKASNLIQKGAISMAKSIPAGLAATAGAYFGIPKSFCGDGKSNSVLGSIIDKKDAKLCAMIFDMGSFIRMIHRISAHQHETAIHSNQNWRWYRNLV